MEGMGIRLTHLKRVLGAAVAWGVLWSLGVLAILAPILPGVGPRTVMLFGVMGFSVGILLNGGLVYVFRRKDLTEIGLGGLRLLTQQRATGILHIVVASWLALQLVFAQEEGSFAAGFLGPAVIFALAAFPFVLPIWAYFAGVLRLATKAEGQVLFLLTDLVVVPTVFMLFLYLGQGIG